jgi:hypothetical protein
LTDFAKRFWEQAFAVEHFEYGEYFRATFSHARCGEFVQVRLMHDSTSPFYDDSRTIPVEFTSHEQRHTLVFPAYFMQAGVQYGYLKALELSTSAQGCLVSVEKISHPERLPFLITWNIPEDWRGAAMRQTLDTR